MPELTDEEKRVVKYEGLIEIINDMKAEIDDLKDRVEALEA
jgi:hypothetical protein